VKARHLTVGAWRTKGPIAEGRSAGNTPEKIGRREEVPSSRRSIPEADVATNPVPMAVPRKKGGTGSTEGKGKQEGGIRGYQFKTTSQFVARVGKNRA